MRLAALAMCLIVLPVFAQAPKKKVRQQPKPQVPPKTDELASAREATDSFLNGLKLGELPEGKQMMVEAQWITGEADNGENFYLRPKFTEVTTLFEKLFDTDVPGVQGYKRLLDMKAVSEAGTPLLTTYIMVAFKDRRSNKWKILDTGDADDADVDRQVAYFLKTLDDTSISSQQENYLNYGHWLLLAGHTKDAREALTTAMDAATAGGLAPEDDAGLHRHRAQIKALLAVIDAMTAN